MTTGEIPEDAKTETAKVGDHENDTEDQNEKHEVKEEEKKMPLSTGVTLTVQHEDTTNSLSKEEAATQKTHEILEEIDHQEAVPSNNGREENAEVMNKDSFPLEHAGNHTQCEELSYTTSEAQAMIKENQENIEEVKQGTESELSNNNNAQSTSKVAEDITSNVETIHNINQDGQNDSTNEAAVTVKNNPEITAVDQEKETQPDASGLTKNLAEPDKEENKFQREDTSDSQKERISAESLEREQGRGTEHRENDKEGNRDISHNSLNLFEQSMDAIDHEKRADSQEAVNALYKGRQEITNVDQEVKTEPDANILPKNLTDTDKEEKKVHQEDASDSQKEVEGMPAESIEGNGTEAIENDKEENTSIDHNSLNSSEQVMDAIDHEADSQDEANTIHIDRQEIKDVAQEKQTEPDANDLTKNLAEPDKEEIEDKQEDTSDSQEKAERTYAEGLEGKGTEHGGNDKEGKADIARNGLNLPEKVINATDHQEKTDWQEKANAIYIDGQVSTEIVDKTKETIPSTNANEENAENLADSLKVSETMIHDSEHKDDGSSQYKGHISEKGLIETELSSNDNQKSTNTTEDVIQEVIESIQQDEKRNSGNEETVEKGIKKKNGKDEQRKEAEPSDNNNQETTSDLDDLGIEKKVVDRIPVHSECQNEVDVVNTKSHEISKIYDQGKEYETSCRADEESKINIAGESSILKELLPTYPDEDESNLLNRKSAKIVDDRKEANPSANGSEEDKGDVISAHNKVEEKFTEFDAIDNQLNTSSGSKDVTSKEVVHSILKEQLDQRNEEDTAEKINAESTTIVDDRKEATPSTNGGEEDIGDVISTNNETQNELGGIDSQASGSSKVEETYTELDSIDNQENTSSGSKDVILKEKVHSILEEQPNQRNEQDTTEKKNEESTTVDDRKEANSSANGGEEDTGDLISTKNEVEETQTKVDSTDSQESGSDKVEEMLDQRNIDQETHTEIDSIDNQENTGRGSKDFTSKEVVPSTLEEHQDEKNEEDTTEKKIEESTTIVGERKETTPRINGGEEDPGDVISTNNKIEETQTELGTIDGQESGSSKVEETHIELDGIDNQENTSSGSNDFISKEVVHSIFEEQLDQRNEEDTTEKKNEEETQIKFDNIESQENAHSGSSKVQETKSEFHSIDNQENTSSGTKDEVVHNILEAQLDQRTQKDTKETRNEERKEVVDDRNETTPSINIAEENMGEVIPTNKKVEETQTELGSIDSPENTSSGSSKVEETETEVRHIDSQEGTSSTMEDILSNEVVHSEEQTDQRNEEDTTEKINQEGTVDEQDTIDDERVKEDETGENNNEKVTTDVAKTTASEVIHHIQQEVQSDSKNESNRLNLESQQISRTVLQGKENETGSSIDKASTSNATKESSSEEPIPTVQHEGQSSEADETSKATQVVQEIKESTNFEPNNILPVTEGSVADDLSNEISDNIEEATTSLAVEVSTVKLDGDQLQSESALPRQKLEVDEVTPGHKTELQMAMQENEDKTPAKENIETPASVNLSEGIRPNDEKTTENVDANTPPIESSEILLSNQENEPAEEEGNKVKESNLVSLEKENIEIPASLDLAACNESENKMKNLDVIAPMIESSETPIPKQVDKPVEKGVDEDTLGNRIEEQLKVEHEKENGIPTEEVRESNGGSLEKQNLVTPASVDVAEPSNAVDENETKNIDVITPTNESFEIPISKEEDNGHQLPVSEPVKPIQDTEVTKEIIEVEPRESSQVKTAGLEKDTLLVSDSTTDDITERIIQKDGDSDTLVNSSLVEVILRNIARKEDGEQQKQEKSLASILMESNELNKTVNEDESSEAIICSQVVAENVTARNGEIAPLEHENNGKLVITDASHNEEQQALLDLPVSQFLLDRILRGNSVDESGVTTINDAKQDVVESNISSVPEGAISDIQPDKQVNPDTNMSSDTVECKDKHSSSISIPEDHQHENANEKAKEEKQKVENDLVRESKDCLVDEESVKSSDNDYKEKTTEFDKQDGNSLDEKEASEQTPANTLNTIKDQNQHDRVSKKHEEENIKDGEIVTISSSISIVSEAATHDNYETQEKILEPVAQDGSPSVEQETNEETLESSLSAPKEQPDQVNKKHDEEEDAKDRENLVTEPRGFLVGEEPVKSDNEIGETVPELVKRSFVAEELQGEVKEVAETEVSVSDSQTDDMHQNTDYKNELLESKASNHDTESDGMHQSQDVNAEELESKAPKRDVETDDMHQTTEINPELKSNERELDTSIPPPSENTGDDATPKEESTEVELEHDSKIKADDVDILVTNVGNKKASLESEKQEYIKKIEKIPTEALATTNGFAECKGEQISEESNLDASCPVPENSDGTEVKDQKDDNLVQSKVVTAREETMQLSAEETDRTMRNTTDKELNSNAVQPSTVIHESVKDQVASNVLEVKVATLEKDELSEKKSEFVTKEDNTTATKEEKTFEEHLAEYEIDTPLMVEIRGQPKPVNKKHQNKLSEVGSKMKHSIISKVKKAITCTSSTLPA